MSNKVLISVVGVIVAITILVIGIVIGKRISQETAIPDNAQQKCFQAGWDAAKAKYNQVYSKILVPDNTTDDVIVGVVHEINGNRLKVAIKSNNLFNDATPPEFKTITVADNTKITVGLPQDIEELKKKMQEDNFNPTKSVLMVEYKDAILADLKMNQFVMVSGPAGSENQSEFTANDIKAEYVSPEAKPAESDLTSQE